MKPKILLITAFALVAIAQLLVPYRMIRSQADFALSGSEFSFKVRHGGPGYSIRGNYLWLRFEQDRFKVTDKKAWENSQSVFVTFGKDTAGFAMIQDVSKEKPENNRNWVKARAFLQFRDSVRQFRDSVRRDSARFRPPVYYTDSVYLQLTYPFHNFYIGDGNTKEQERDFLQKLNKRQSLITLRVHIRENQFLVDELMVDSVSSRNYLKEIPR